MGWVLNCRFREVRAGLAANEDVSQDFLDRGSEPGGLTLGKTFPGQRRAKAMALRHKALDGLEEQHGDT